ncbi:uncharacterized protein [Nicotiana sylvestris]|uniref:uncharacterized protein n=1 Tax=Nicotiana sylvestris TaxID=4096 RepID=UPI00388CB5CB
MTIVSCNLLEGMVYADSAQDVWEDLKERFNKVDGSRSFSLYQEIVRLTQGTASVATYFTKLKELWVELEALGPLPECKCDKSREFARSQILLMIPLSSVNQAYAMIVSDEAQKAMGAASNSVGLLGTMPNLDPTTMYSKTGYQNQRFRKTSNLYCDHCKMRNYTKENCYKLKGYLQDSRFKRKEGSGGSSAAYNVLSQEANDQMTQLDNQGNNKVSRIHYTDTPSQVTQVPGQITQTRVCAFTHSQYDQIVQMLNQSHQQSTNSRTGSSANVAGIEPCIYSSKVMLISKILKDRIIDTGATNHMVSDINVLDRASLLKSTNGKNVQLPNGEVSKYLYNGKVKEIGKEDDGLYLLSNKSTGKLGGTGLNAHEVTVNIAEIDKLQPRTRTSVLMGYSEVQKGYILYDITNKCFFVNRDVSFGEDTSSSYQESSRNQQLQTPIAVPLAEITTEIQSTLQSQISAYIQPMPQITRAPIVQQLSSQPVSKQKPRVELTRKSTRTSRPPIWKKDFISLSLHNKANYPISNYISYNNISPKYTAFLAAFSSVTEPQSYTEAAQDPSWIEAMQAEIKALQENNTWEIVNLPEGKKPIRCKWIYKVKYKATGEVEKVKSRLVAKNYSQQEGDLTDEIYMTLPQGFQSQGETKRTDRGTTVVLIYVDDMLITGDSLELIQDTKVALQKAFKIKDLGELKYFLGIQFARSEKGILMHQRKYALALISKLGLLAAKPIGTPMDSDSKLTTKEYDEHLSPVSITKDEVISGIGSYQRLIGKLLYLTVTRPDIAFSVQNL